MQKLVATLAILVTGLVMTAAGDAGAQPLGRPGVTISSSADSSPGVLDAHARRRHAAVIRQALADALHRTGADVRHAGMPRRQIDATVVSWQIVPAGELTEVATELRVVICDDRGKMLAIMTGRARISVPRRGAALDQLREQALAEAISGMTESLHQQLARTTS